MPPSRIPPSLAAGVAVIREAARQAPDRPGVYTMHDADDVALYVGKARRLRPRIASYASLSGKPRRIEKMIALTARISWTLTASEAEALLLEANVVKRLQPRYNVLLRDDKSFPYLLIADDHEAPRLLKYRGARSRRGRYFGPFASGRAVNRAMATLQRGFLLRSCPDSVYAHRSRPCLLHQIGRCSAPCTGEISIEAYRKLVAEAAAFLDGKSVAIRDALTETMQQASERLDYERAANMRDRIAALNYAQTYSGMTLSHRLNADLFAFMRRDGIMAVETVGLRGGADWGDKTFFPRVDAEIEPAAAAAPFLAQYYRSHPPPPLILTNIAVAECALLEKALSLRAGRRVRIAVPQRGEKRRLTIQAERNAEAAIVRRLAETADLETSLATLADLLDLKATPQRIEVYDNSHFQGDHPLGAMIVLTPKGFDKASYRRFNIRATPTPGDDPGMMREVLSRRFRNAAAVVAAAGDSEKKDSDEKDSEKNEKTPPPDPRLPDLLLIDGGAPQLGAALEVLRAVGLEAIPAVGIAKGPDRNAGRERLYIPGRKPLSLPERDPLLHFLQRLRDEAHRFAVGSARRRRRRAQGASSLDAIPGIGPRRKRALLRRLGSSRAVALASARELAATPGIDEKLAAIIHDHFRDG